MKPDRCSDRFIPARAGARWHIDFNLISEKTMEKSKDNNKNNEQTQTSNTQQTSSQQQQTGQNNRKTRNVTENGKGILINYIIQGFKFISRCLLYLYYY